MTRKESTSAYLAIAGQLARCEHYLGELKPANAYRNVRRRLPTLTRAEFDARYLSLAKTFSAASANLGTYLHPSKDGYARFNDVDVTSLSRNLAKANPDVPIGAIRLMVQNLVYWQYLR